MLFKLSIYAVCLWKIMSTFIKLWIFIAAPVLVPPSNGFVINNTKTISDTSATVQVCQCLLDNGNGEITMAGLVICKKDAIENCSPSKCFFVLRRIWIRRQCYKIYFIINICAKFKFICERKKYFWQIYNQTLLVRKMNSNI